MNIILGASGQVGSHIIKMLAKSEAIVRAVVRKTNSSFDSHADVRSADFLEPEKLKRAMEGAKLFSYSHQKIRPLMISWETQNGLLKITEQPFNPRELKGLWDCQALVLIWTATPVT